MAPVASKLDTLPFNCYELGHTWHHDCNRAAFDLGFSTLKQGIKIYATCYLISLLASQRFPKTKEAVIKALKDILRSSTFLASHGFFFVYFLCKLRKAKGNFNFFTLAYVPSFISAYISIMIEKPQRRPLLALYVANVATETTYRMLRARGLVRDVKNFELFLFCFSCVTLIYYMKEGVRKMDVVDSVFKKIFGPDEFAEKRDGRDVRNLHDSRRSNNVVAEAVPRRVSLGGPGLRVGGTEAENNRRRERGRDDTFRNRFIHFVLWMHKSVEDIASHLERMVAAVYEGQIHEMCPHTSSCFDYWMEGFYTRFLSGCAIHGVFQIMMFAKNLLGAKKLRIDKTGSILSNSLLLPCVKSGMGLGIMCLSFRLINCSFRWLKGMDGPGHAAFAGFLSSALGFFMLRPPNSLGVYLFFKALESLVSSSHKKNNWKILNLLNQFYGGGWCLLYSICTALLFHVAVVEPHNLKPSYYHFLSKTTGKRLYDINRQILDIYGTKSSMLMNDFWPNLKPDLISSHMKQLLKIREEINYSNEVMLDMLKNKFVNIS